MITAVLPLKEGLKQTMSPITISMGSYYSGTSIKRRIETGKEMSNNILVENYSGTSIKRRIETGNSVT